MRRRSNGERGLTLVELLIAVSLGTLLIGIITFVWVQSSRIVTDTIDRIDAYENLRSVLDVVERDLANTSRTIDMEFFEDKGDKNGRFDPGEELKVAGTHFRTPRDKRDPLAGPPVQPEFADPPLNDATKIPYYYSPMISSPAPYVDKRGEAHWRDEVYARSFAMVGGINRSALVHYRLVDTDKAAPKLRRRVWFLDKEGKIAAPDPASPEKGSDVSTLLAERIFDLKIGFYFKESPTVGNGVLYHVRPDGPLGGEGEAGKELVQRDSRFQPARGAVSKLKTKPVPGGANALTFMYEGWGKFEFTEEFGVLFRPLETPIDSAPPITTTPDHLAGYSPYDFPGVRAGDKVYVFDTVDDDDDGDPAAKAKRETEIRPKIFRDKYFTVQQVVSQTQFDGAGNKVPTAPKAVSLRFEEVIDYFALKDWLWAEPVAKLDAAGVQPSFVKVPRTVTQAFYAKFRIGFLPSAYHVRVTYDDRRRNRVIPFERVVRLLNQ